MSTSNAERAEQIREATYGHTYRCAKCRASTNGLFGPNQAALLVNLGWHQLPSLDWVCSKLCLEWAKFHAESEALKPSLDINDRAYHKRRAQAASPKK